ncbi:MAG TPA: hypothetical protein PLK99_10095 [Burkholderiales bacterium]|nr:hypothetical protein [Burkholderiales bacterium]
MDKEIRRMVEEDVGSFRKKAKFYRENHLHEAAVFADRLASNLELALTTMPREDDPEIV